MKAPASIFLLLLACSFGLAQTGRRVSAVKDTPPADQAVAPVSITALYRAARLPKEKHHDYRCTKDGSHHAILDTDGRTEEVLSSKLVDTRAVFRSKPKPGYTMEARRNRKQGFVILKVVLSATGTIGRVRVLRGLPFGLTESAIKAACKLQFKPAMKDGYSVSQWVTAEYIFRLPDSRLFKP